MIQIKIYFNNIWKQKLWHENIPKIVVEQTKSNGRSYAYLYPIGDLVQENFHRGFHVCTNQISFLIIFLNNNELIVN
jgi:hypothetical protein